LRLATCSGGVVVVESTRVFLEAPKRGGLWTFLRERDRERERERERQGVLERRDDYGFDVETVGTI